MIELNDVQKSHFRGQTEVKALRGVTATIEKGSFTFILGPSGSGKSTLLYLLGALDTPTGGSISVAGTELASMTDPERDTYRREQVGFIFQSFNLLANATAAENVLVPFVPSGVTPELREKAKDLLTTVGLGDRLDHRPSHLSGGEQQRVAIARALLKAPELVLADEPTGELDSETGREIFKHLRALHQEQQSTVVIVTHDPSHIIAGDHIMRIRDGRLESMSVADEDVASATNVS